jgi:hypothetical protein
MLGYCANYLATMPDITVYMNCDTRLAINISMFELGEYDELIFVIKNYSYKDSSYVYLFRAHKGDEDKNGEVVFKIDPDVSKLIKPGAFYNFAILINALDKYVPTEYKKLTDNGRVLIEYGAQDLLIDGPVLPSPFADIMDARIEPVDDNGIDLVTGITAIDTITNLKMEELPDSV